MLGKGNKAESADKIVFYNRFIAIVQAPTESSIVWWRGNFPHQPFHPSLGPRTFPGVSNPANMTPTPGVKITRASFVDPNTIFNTLHTYANRLTRIRNVTYIYRRNPPPDEVGGPAKTAMSNAYLSTILKPGEPPFAVGTPIATDPMIDAFMTAMKANLDAFIAGNPVTITMCHSSCHSSCHGSRGRR